MASGRFDSYYVTAVAEAQSELSIWNAVQNTVESKGLTYREAATQLAQRLQRHLLGSAFQGESRSTSQMSNLMNDIQYRAEARFVTLILTEDNEY